MELDRFKVGVDAWLDDEADALAPEFEGIGTLAQQLQQLNKVRRRAYDAGWARLGWLPQRQPRVGPIEHMIDIAALRCAPQSSHARHATAPTLLPSRGNGS